MMNVLHPANIRGSHPPGVEILSDSGRRKDHLHHHHASPLVVVSDTSNSANTGSSMCTPTGTMMILPRANKRQLETSESSDDAACPNGTISTAGEGLLKRLKLAYTEYKNEHHQHQPHRPLPVTSKLPSTRSPPLAPSSSLAVAASSASAVSDYEDIVSSALQEVSRDHEEDNRWVDQLSHLGDVDHSTVVERQQGASAARTAQSHHHANATAATGTMPIALGSDDPILLSYTPLKLFASILHKNDGMDTPQQEQAKKPFESLGSPPAGRATTATMIAPVPRNPLDCQHLQHPEYEQPMLGRVLPPRAPPPPLPLIAMRPRMGLLRQQQQQQYLRPKPHFVPDGSLSQHERSLCHPLASNDHLSATTASVAATTSGAAAAKTTTSLPQTDNNTTAPQIMPMNDMASVMSSPEPTVLTLTSFPFRVICANPAFFQLTGDVGREVIGSSVYNIIASGGSGGGGGGGGVKDNKKNHTTKKGHNDDLASSSSSSSPSMATRTPMETFLHNDIVKVVVQQQQPKENFSSVNNEDDEGEPLWNHQAEQQPPVMMMVEGAVGGWNDDADMVPPDYDDDDCSSISSTNSLVVASTTTTTTTTTTTSCRIQVQNVMDQKGQDLLYFSIQLSPVHLPSK